MSKHTPGPWSPGHPDQDDDRQVVCSLSEGWSVVALQADPAKYEPEADARLIAAAPELLESLEKLHSFFLSKGDVWTIEDQKAASKAIAKAKGGQG